MPLGFRVLHSLGLEISPRASPSNKFPRNIFSFVRVSVGGSVVTKNTAARQPTTSAEMAPKATRKRAVSPLKTRTRVGKSGGAQSSRTSRTKELPNQQSVTRARSQTVSFGAEESELGKLAHEASKALPRKRNRRDEYHEITTLPWKGNWDAPRAKLEESSGHKVTPQGWWETVNHAAPVSAVDKYDKQKTFRCLHWRQRCMAHSTRIVARSR